MKYDRCVCRIIRRFRRWPSAANPFSDCEAVKDCWEAIVVYVRGQQPDNWDQWEQAIESECAGIVERQRSEDQAILWMGTDEAFEHEGNEIPWGGTLVEAVNKEMYRRVLTAAEDKRIPERLDEFIERSLSGD